MAAEHRDGHPRSARKASKRPIVEESEEDIEELEEIVAVEPKSARKRKQAASRDEDEDYANGAGPAEEAAEAAADKRARAHKQDKPAKRKERTPSPDYRHEDDAEEEGDHAIDEEEEEEELTQRHNLSQAMAQPEPTEADAGIIERIYLENFLCHSKLDVSLGPNLNFIHGKNGSGKSAILTAISVGLGGRVRSTGRGDSLVDLIQTGKTSASVTITLRNRGLNAYKPDLYGETIEVVRTIRKDKTSSYALRGRLSRAAVSTSKAELTAMTDHFNIQVDNPLIVLNQEASKNFLVNSTDEKKFQFFFEGTQLQQMTNDVEMIQADLKKIGSCLDKKDSVVSSYRDRALAAEERYKATQKLQEYRAQLAALKAEAVWAEICEKERAAQHIATQLHQEEAVHAANVAKYNELSNAATIDQSSLGEKNGRLTQIESEKRQLSEEMRKLLAQSQAAKKACRQIEGEIKSYENAIRARENEKHRLAADLEEKRQASSARAKERQRKATLVREKEGDLDKLRKEGRALKLGLEEMEARTSDIHKLRSAASSERSGIDSELRQLQGRLKTYEGSKINRVNLYGPKMDQVVAAINADRGFSKKPIGPLGLHVQLVDRVWAEAVDTIIGKYFGNFIVNTHEDMNRLKEIYRKVNGRIDNNLGIICVRFSTHPYDNLDGVTVRGFPTILDVLRVQDPTVLNCLIDQAQIHRIILCMDRAEACSLLRTATERDVHCAMVKTGQQVFPGKTHRVLHEPRGRGDRLAENFDERIRECQDAKTKLQARLAECVQKEEDLAAQSNATQRQQGEKRSALTKLNRAISQKEQEINELRVEEEEITEESYEEEFRVIDAEIAKTHSKIADLKERLKGITTDRDKDQVERLAQQIQSLQSEESELMDQLGELQSLHGKATERVSRALQIMRKSDETVHRLRLELGGRQTEIDALVSKATALGYARIETTRKWMDVVKQGESIQKVIKRQEERTGSVEEVTAEYERATTEFQRLQKSYKSQRALEIELKKTIDVRDHAMEEYIKYNAALVRFYFTQLVHERGYTGRLEIDKKKRTVKIEVRVDQTRAHDSKETRGLSGGERSYSTVCFIAAMWEAMEAPFRCLDEFDVFMDMVNRRYSMRTLAAIASKQKNRQFVLLTPQSLVENEESLGKGIKIKTLQLRDPIRGQRTLEEVTSVHQD